MTPLRLESPVSYDEKELEALLEAEKLTSADDSLFDDDTAEDDDLDQVGEG